MNTSRLDASRIEDVGDISKLKVAELKQQLKIRGLLVTGNKTELVERLQEAIGKDGTQGINAGADDEEFDEEEILGGDDAEEDIGKITPQEEAAALAGSIRIKKSKLLVVSSDKKKISLKRSEPSLDTSAVTPSIATEEETVADTETNASSADNKENASVDEPKHKVIKLSDSTNTDSEGVLEARAKKFGVTAPESEGTAKAARAARFGITNSSASSDRKQSRLSTETGGTDVEKLKKRAERFGEVTSKSLSKIETVEKIKKRQERFGEATKEASKIVEKVTPKETVVKKTANGITPVMAPSTDEAAVKAKRAERFAL